MSNGRIITWYPPVECHVLLLENQSATGSGPWIEIPAGMPNWTFAVDTGDTLEEGASDATVDIMVANDETRPATATDGEIALTLSLSNQAGATVTSGYRWCKAKKTEGSTPAAVTVYGRFTQMSSS